MNEIFVKDINDIEKFNLKYDGVVNCNEICRIDDKDEVCGIRDDGDGYKIRLFENKCEMNKYNCENDIQFTLTDNFICNASLSLSYDDNRNETIDVKYTGENVTNLVVVNTNMFGDYDDLNDTIDTFFAASHVFDLPVKEFRPLDTRRKWLKYAGPVNVFVPVIKKPQNVSNETFYIPTLSSCYHKCPTVS